MDASAPSIEAYCKRNKLDPASDKANYAWLAIIFAINRFGFLQGKTGPTTAGAGSAQVAAVIVVPTALNHATAAVEGLTMAVIEGNVIARQHSTATDRLAEQVEHLGEGIDRLRDEVIRSAAKIK